jgi:ribosomal protein S18 acetylase RimI-like enzyme
MAIPERADAATIRMGVPADVEALARVSRLAYGATYQDIVPSVALAEWIETAPAMWQAAFDHREPDGPWRPWVAERAGVIVGYATTSPGKDWWLPPPDGAGELTNLYLDPAAIGSGVGGALYDHAVADLRSRGFNPFVVWAFRDNHRARRFYEGRGLTIDVPDHDWVLAGVPCPIVRFRIDWPAPASG